MTHPTLFPTPPASRYLHTCAEISPCGVYRYSLRRVWNAHRDWCLFVLLNPSTADSSNDDPTIHRCVSFADLWGYGGLVVVNLFALRSTDPRALYTHPDPVGPKNDAVIAEWAAACPLTVAAWGAHGEFRERGKQVAAELRRLGVEVKCLGMTKGGEPKHPLYLAGSAGLVPYDAPLPPSRNP